MRVGDQRERRGADSDRERRGERPGVGSRRARAGSAAPRRPRAPAAAARRARPAPATGAPRARSARARSRAAAGPPVSRLGRWSRRDCRSATASGSRSSRGGDLAAVDLVGDVDAEVLEHGRSDVGGETSPSVRVEAEVRLPSNPAPAIPVGKQPCSASRAGGDRDQQVVGPEARGQVVELDRGRSGPRSGPGRSPPAQSAADRMTPVAVDADQRGEPGVRLGADRDPASASVEASRPGTMFAGRAVGAVDDPRPRAARAPGRRRTTSAAARRRRGSR